ncbi:MAG: hypothetical protein IKB43_04250 [Fibrobacter sp.]|nr:hypothetical protein [Fibrobacter sp.]
MSTVFIILLVILLIIVGIILLVNIGIRFAIFTASAVIDIVKSPASLFFIMCFIGFAIFVLVDMKKSPSGSSYDHGNDIPVATEYKQSHPEETYQKPDERTYKQTDDTEPSIDNVNYDVPLQTGSNHDYIMENTFQKPGVVMELTPQLESGLVYAIKVFKSQFGPDFSPTIISARDSYHIHDRWSPHRYGQAVDISLADLPLNQRRRVVRILEGTLPKDYKVRWEDKYLSNEHIHLQFRL